MLCWYFGNFPGIIEQGGGHLSFEPFPESEETFLKELARPDWGKQADKVAQAWKRMADGYEHMPLITEFQWCPCTMAWSGLCCCVRRTLRSFRRG